MRSRLGYTGGPKTAAPDRLHRVDREEARGPFRPHELDDASSPALIGLRSGDLILAKNTKPQSLASTLTVDRFCLYDHMGVLAIEEDHAWVYESWPKLVFLTLAPNFASRFRGEVARVPLSRFAERYETLEFVRLPDPERNQRMVEGARASQHEDIPYDPLHDPDDPALSCSEYVLYLVEDKAGYGLGIEPCPILDNPSLKRLVASLGFSTDFGFLMPDVFLSVDGAQSVGVISRHETQAEVLAVRLAYEAMYDDFVTHSEVGSYLAFDNWRLLRYRDYVAAFLEWSLGYFAQNPTADPEAIRRDLALMRPIFFRHTVPVQP